jgi:mycothiol synthase
MAPIKPALEGLVLRPYRGEQDVADIVRVANAEHAADGIREHYSVDERAAEYRHPSEMFDAARDVTVALVDDTIVGYGSREWIDTTDGEYREYRVDGAVHPDWRRRGIGAALLAENMRQARNLAATHDTSRRQIFGSYAGDTQPADHALLRGVGFEQVRWFFEMTRPTLDAIPDVPLPAGLEVRPVSAVDTKQVWDADVEAFLDHWGGFDASEESMRRYMESPTFDPSLWVIAFDGDQVAGGVINGIYPEENETLGLRRGWLDSVFTRRPWRRRGLARALISQSLALLRGRGMTSAVLGVDADNPTGALGLYESVGFEVSYRASAWRKPLET